MLVRRRVLSDVTDTVSASFRVWSPCGAASTLVITNQSAVIVGNYASGDTSSNRSNFNGAAATTHSEWRSC
jgi:hypothetical protein